MNISAGIVIYNSDFQDVCGSIDSFLEDGGSNIILINNNSTDNIFQKLLHKYQANKQILFANLESNKGFGGAHNFGFWQLETLNKLGKYHIILNPDVYILKNCLNTLYSYMESDYNIVSCCPKILNPDYTLQPLNKEFPNIFDMVIRRFLPKFIKKMSYFKNRYDKYIRIHVGYDAICEVPFASGCFMFFDSEKFKQLNGFDERYFLYMEDADICRRAWKIGKIMYNPNAQIIHKWSRASHKSLKMTLIFAKSVLKYFTLPRLP